MARRRSRSLFEAIERSKLKPLPTEPFVVGQWRVARVDIDYHVAVDGHFYPGLRPAAGNR